MLRSVRVTSRVRFAVIAGMVGVGSVVGGAGAALAAKPGSGGGGGSSSGITGRVTKAVSGLPPVALPGICVTAGRASAITDASGAYTLSVARGSYTVTAASCAPSDAFAPAALTAVVVASGQLTSGQDVTLQPKASRGARAMWLDQFPSGTSYAAVVSFIRTNDVTDVFAAVTSSELNSPTEEQAYHTLIQAAHDSGATVEALYGDPSWATAAHEQDGVALTNDVNSFDATAPGFDGVHLDIEPWALPDWSTNQQTDVAGYLQVLSDIKSAVSPLPVEVDITTWLNTVSTSSATNLDAAVASAVDAVTIMSFSNTSSAILSSSQTEYNNITSAGKPVRLAAETLKDARGTTFSGSTLTKMYPQLEAVDAAHVGDVEYRGVSIQDYAGWTAMRA